MKKDLRPHGQPPFAPSRRRFMFRSAIALAFGGVGIAALDRDGAAWIASASAQQASQALPGVQPGATGAGFDAFMALSRYLTGKSALDADQAQALYAGLLADQADLPQHIAQLQTFIAQTSTSANQLQQVLDAQSSPLAALPKLIMKGWYLGIVGSGAKARAVAYEQALMYPPIADVIVMPTYARGEPGYWAAPPSVLLSAAHS